MSCISNINAIRIMENTLNMVDPRLIDHGRRVAYMVCKMLKCQKKYSDREISDFCVLSLIHDIGAYKTEEINRMLEFETSHIGGHSVYGYLFIKYFSPIPQYADIILYHHAYCGQLSLLAPCFHDIVQMIHLADRMDILVKSGAKEHLIYTDFLKEKRSIQFSPEIIDLLYAAEIDSSLSDEEKSADPDFRRYIYGAEIIEDMIQRFLKMTVLSVDFRSRHTVTHTISSTCIAAVLADMLNLFEEDKEKVYTAALLHDLGKTAIPLEILEGPGKLNPREMAAIKTHVNITDEIIRGHVDNDIWNIVVRHHEKLNGSGYPGGLAAKDLNISQRILTVSDIFSALCEERSYKKAFPKEKVISILSEMAADGLIDPDITAAAIRFYDHIKETVEKETRPVLCIYKKIVEEEREILDSNELFTRPIAKDRSPEHQGHWKMLPNKASPEEAEARYS
ncbi:HD domain-containing protein [Treponema sp. OttesenSCG-928-L16]|nr:HD domain-containing protein [Treponema sp. OttesenSCG-928-L16]